MTEDYKGAIIRLLMAVVGVVLVSLILNALFQEKLNSEASYLDGVTVMLQIPSPISECDLEINKGELRGDNIDQVDWLKFMDLCQSHSDSKSNTKKVGVYFDDSSIIFAIQKDSTLITSPYFCGALLEGIIDPQKLKIAGIKIVKEGEGKNIALRYELR